VREEEAHRLDVGFRTLHTQKQKRVTAKRRNPLPFRLAGVLYEVQKSNLGRELEVIRVEFERRGTALVPVGV
jgi:hypothetical protein